VKKVSNILILVCLTIVPTIIIWLPFYLRLDTFWSIPLNKDGMATIVANFDGPLYLIAAKTLYNPEQIGSNYQFPLSNEYYSAHFPLFPFLIKAFSPLLGYPYSMLLVTVLSSFLAIYFFYLHSVKLVDKNQALFLTFIFSIFPARWLIVRSVGSAEPLFVATILASTYYFADKKYFLAGLWGLLAQMTKSPGILLFIGYFLSMLVPLIKSHKWQEINLKKYLPILLIPFGLVLVFSFYFFRYGDFWVYFKSGDNIHLFFPPFQIFNYSAPWVGTFWIEEVIFFYLVGVLAIYKLYQQKLYTYFYFTLVFFTSLLFVSHRDLLRYAIPIIPFIIFTARELLIKKEFKIALTVIIIPIFLYSLAFISQNTMPIANWTPFL